MAQDGICEACLFHWSPGVLSMLPNIEVFSCNVEEVMKNPTYLRTERTLDCIECFAGTATIYNAACARGHKAVAIDKNPTHRSHVTCDLATPCGFEKLLTLLFALREHGLLWLAPTCRSMGFCNQRNTKRNHASSNNFNNNVGCNMM